MNSNWGGYLGSTCLYKGLSRKRTFAHKGGKTSDNVAYVLCGWPHSQSNDHHYILEYPWFVQMPLKGITYRFYHNSLVFYLS